MTDPSHARARENQEDGDGLTAAAHLRRHVALVRQGPVKRLSERWVGWACRPFTQRGWSPADLAFAVAHHPADGRHRGSAGGVTIPGAWLGWRLSRWMTDPDLAWAHWREHGRWPAGMLPDHSPTARRWREVKPVGDVYVERNRAKAAAAAAPDPASWADRIRRQLGWRKQGGNP